MNVAHVEALPLDFNGCVQACFDLMLDGKKFMTKAKLLKHLQNVCIVYACLAIKRNDGIVGEKAKHAHAAKGFEEVAVPGFLKWASENSVALPSWLTVDMLGRSTMTGGEGEGMGLDLPSVVCGRPLKRARAAGWC